MALSISVCLNGTQADVLQRPELCDEAISLGNKFLNKVTLARDFWQALKEPRPLKSRKSFLRFVFERGHSQNKQSRNRQLRLRAMSSISLVLCSATFTENMILKFSGELFNTLLAHVGDFLGNPEAVISELPDDVIRTCFTTKMIPESAKAYAQFCSEIEKYQDCKVIEISGVVPYRDARADDVITWPQGQVTGILCVDRSSVSSSIDCRGAQSATFSAVVRQLARLYKETGRSIPFSNDVTEAFIAASKSRPLHERMHLLDTAAEMLTDEAPISAWTAIVHQRSVVLRLQGDPRRAELEIRAYLSKRSHIPDHLLHVLQLSLANNCIYQLRHDDADQIAHNIQLQGGVHEHQVPLVWDHIYCVGRIMRGRGDFESAKFCFEQCSATNGIPVTKRAVIQSALSDVCCELDYVFGHSKSQYLRQARSMLVPAFELVGTTNPRSRRRLLLSLSEVDIRQGRLLEARASLEELLKMYSGLQCLDIVDRLGHVRSCMALARTYPPEQAERHWQEALRLNAMYNPEEEDVFTCAVIYLHLSWLSSVTERPTAGQETYARACAILHKRKPEFLIPGIGTYIYHDIMYKLQHILL